MIGLTSLQADLLDFLRAESASGRSPTLQACCDALGLTAKSQVVRLRRSLIERGHVIHRRYLSPSMVVLGFENGPPTTFIGGQPYRFIAPPVRKAA